MLDMSLVLCEKKSVASTFQSDVIDLGQASPNTGSLPLAVVVMFPTAGTGADASNSVQFGIQTSDDKSSWVDSVQIQKIPGVELKGAVVIPMPIKHGRYVRLQGTVAGTVTGACTAYVSNSYALPMCYQVQGIKIIQTAD